MSQPCQFFGFRDTEAIELLDHGEEEESEECREGADRSDPQGLYAELLESAARRTGRFPEPPKLSGMANNPTAMVPKAPFIR